METHDLPVPAGALFVDLPNITLGPAGTRRRKIVFRKLTAVTEPALKGTVMVHQGVYVKWEGNYTGVRALRQSMGSLGDEAILRNGRDIDSYLISDIWASVIGYQNALLKRGQFEFPLRVRHVLVSGDAGYARTYESMRKLYGNDLDLHLTVYAWRGTLGKELKNFANQVRYLDDIPGIWVWK